MGICPGRLPTGTWKQQTKIRVKGSQQSLLAAGMIPEVEEVHPEETEAWMLSAWRISWTASIFDSFGRMLPQVKESEYLWALFPREQTM